MSTKARALPPGLPDLPELQGNFELFHEWEERYRYLIDLGRLLPAMPEDLKTEETLVRGCTSRVWLVPTVREGVLHFIADSDAHIVRGLVALLYAAYQGQDLGKIKDVKIEDFFKTIGLDQNLSPNRRNGFYAMVERIKAFAV